MDYIGTKKKKRKKRKKKLNFIISIYVNIIINLS